MAFLTLDRGSDSLSPPVSLWETNVFSYIYGYDI